MIHRPRFTTAAFAAMLVIGFVVTTSLLGCTSGGGSETGARADVVLSGGTIHTLADGRPSTVEALAIHDGAVVGAGTRDEVEAAFPNATTTIDLQGRTVVPGLVDAHAHLLGLGGLLSEVDLVGTQSAEECVELGLRGLSELGPGNWLYGRGWDQNDWAVQEFPHARLLDEAFGDRPVVFERIDGHALWVSSAALRLAGIDASTPDPSGGEIVRDADGEPTGVLVDDAEDLVLTHAPPMDAGEIERRYRLAVAEAVRHGLTGVHDMGVTLEQLEVLRRGEREGWLDLRMVVYLAGDAALRAYEGEPDAHDPRARVRVQGVKLYADGALGSRGAALLEDYTDRPGHRGLLIHEPEVLAAQIAHAFERGFPVAVHAIGDRANRLVIDTIVATHADLRERGVELPPLAQLRPRIEHAQILDPEDIPRFAALGILPSVQPTHCTSDMPWAPDRLGPDRLEGAYAWRSLRDDGNLLPLGSDFPVEDVSPWLGLHAAITRQRPDGTPPEGWAPEQRLEPLEALLGFTSWPAEAIDEPRWGSLAVGRRADLVVIDRDPLAIEPSRLLDTRVLLTMVDGEVVHRDPTWTVGAID